MKYIKKIVKLIILATLILALVILYPKINFLYQNVEILIGNSGIFAPLTYIMLMIIAILVSPIPSSPLAIIGGAIFGPFLGMIYTLIGATIGAVFAFIIARFFLRDYVSKKLERSNFYQKIKGKDEKNIAKIIFFTRLMPHVSFDIVSYAAGLTNLNTLTFALVTFFGMIPIVFLLSFFGSVIEPYLPIMLLIISILFILYLIKLIFREKIVE